LWLASCSACCCIWSCASSVVLLLLWPAASVLAQHGLLDRTLLPVDLPWLVLFKGARQVRTLGLSSAGDPAAHHDVRLAEADRAHYTNEGYVLVRGVVNSTVLEGLRAALYRELGPASWPWHDNSFMTVDTALDFYIFSNLPSLAAQLLGSGHVSSSEAMVHLWSDFSFFRSAHGPPFTEPHIDEWECEGLLPASRSRVRAWVTLDDDVVAPLLLSQSVVAAHLNETERRSFWRGELLMERLPRDSAVAFLWNRFVPTLRDWTLLPGLRRGDVLFHSPCLLHMSPPSNGRLVASVSPVYAPAESRAFGRAAGAHRQCRHRVPEGAAIGGRRDPCFLQVHPRDPDIRSGARISFESARFSWRRLSERWWQDRWLRSRSRSGWRAGRPRSQEL